MTDLLIQIDAYFADGKRPPIDGDTMNFFLKKMIQFSSGSIPVPLIDTISGIYADSAALNVVYPTAKINQIIICPNANVIYTKLDNSSSGIWGSGPFNTL